MKRNTRRRRRFVAKRAYDIPLPPEIETLLTDLAAVAFDGKVEGGVVPDWNEGCVSGCLAEADRELLAGTEDLFVERSDAAFREFDVLLEEGFPTFVTAAPEKCQRDEITALCLHANALLEWPNARGKGAGEGIGRLFAAEH